jgi:hypothetical protein
MQGLICPRCILWLYEVLRSWDACRDSRVGGRIDLWLFVPLVIVLSIVFCEFIAYDIQDCFLHGYDRNIVCLKDSFVPT